MNFDDKSFWTYLLVFDDDDDERSNTSAGCGRGCLVAFAVVVALVLLAGAIWHP